MAMSICSSVMIRSLPQMVWHRHHRTVQMPSGLVGYAAARCTPDIVGVADHEGKRWCTLRAVSTGGDLGGEGVAVGAASTGALAGEHREIELGALSQLL